MFEKGDVYTIDGEVVRWVGVVTSPHPASDSSLLPGSVRAIEMAYDKQSGEFLFVDAHAYFNVERPGQRVLLQVATKEEVENA